MSRMGELPPVSSAVETPSIPSSRGRTSSSAMRAASTGSAPGAAPMVAVTTGSWSMLKDITMGSTSAGSVAEPSERSMSSTAVLGSVPKSNSAKIIDIEFDELDCVPSRLGTLIMARSSGSVTWAATVSAPAPGMGLMTITKGSWMSGMSSCLSVVHE